MSEQQNNTEDSQQLPTMNAGTQLFSDLDADVSATEIESLCMRCGKNGKTRLLLTRIPHFKSIIVMAFECPHCGWKNNEVQSGEAIQEKGHIYQCTCTCKADLNRQIVRNGTATVSIPKFDFSAPPSKTSVLTTVEGIIQHFINDLSSDQPQRQTAAPEVYQAIENLISNLNNALSLPEEDVGETENSFTITIDDPTGNSYLENLCVPNVDPKLSIKHYTRTHEQEIELGLVNPDGEATDVPVKKPRISMRKEAEASKNVIRAVKEASDSNEIISFPANCSSCNAPCDTRMQMIDIPHFKDVIIMSTTCDQCGYKSNEVKCGGAISPKGKRIILKMDDREDLSRDILKSETSGLAIPEVELDLVPGTLGGRFTTVEGLIRQVHDELDRRVPFLEGDSVSDERRQKFEKFLKKLEDAADGKLFPLTLILDDPVANSYIQNIYAPDPDPNMKEELYDRTFEQNEDLGLNDIDVGDE